MAEDFDEAGPNSGVAKLGADFDEETVEARSLRFLVVASEDEDVVGELALEGEEKHDGLDTLWTSVNVIAQEEELAVRLASRMLFEDVVNKIGELAVDITDDDKSLIVFDCDIQQGVFCLEHIHHVGAQVVNKFSIAVLGLRRCVVFIFTTIFTGTWARRASTITNSARFQQLFHK